MQAGQELASGNQDDRKPKNSVNTTHELGPFLKGKSMAHDGNVKMACTASLEYIFQRDCGHYVKAGHAQSGISGADQIA